mgnify:CR=1 FL=1
MEMAFKAISFLSSLLEWRRRSLRYNLTRIRRIDGNFVVWTFLLQID